MDILNFFIGAVIQLIAFSLIPFLFWLIGSRKKENFFHYIGLHGWPAKQTVKIVLIAIGIAVGFSVLMYFIMPYIMGDAESATTQFAGSGWSMLPQILIYAFIQTSLSEEIFFRGFIGKHLSNKIGFGAGNLIQAVLFGLMHTIPFGLSIGWFPGLLIGLITGAIGWLQGYVNKKVAKGSIGASWMIHGLMNFLSALAGAF